MYTLSGILTLLYLFGTLSLASTTEKGTIIPLYSYPKTNNGGNAWKSLLNAYKMYPIEVWAIVNVDSGPGTSKNSDYGSAISNLKSVGINTLGYVSTSYARRNVTLVRKDIDLWKSWYGTTGIFLDEMTNADNASYIQFYQDLDIYCKNHGFTFTVGNPGTNVPIGYFQAVDTIMIYESQRLPNPKTICDNKDYKSLGDSSALGIFPYDVQALNETMILKTKDCVGYIYLTNDKGSNPWDTLPPYLSKLFKILSR